MLEVLDLELVACVHVAADRFPHGPPGLESVDLTRPPRPIDREVPANAFLWCSSPLSNRIRPHNPRTSGSTPWRAFGICRGAGQSANFFAVEAIRYRALMPFSYTSA